MWDQLPLHTLPPDAVEVGKIAGVFGIKGILKIQSHSASAGSLCAQKNWYLQGRLTPSDKAHSFPIDQVTAKSQGLLARSTLVVDRTQAESLIGARIFISRAHFPITKEDEYYWIDLIGMQAKNREAVVLGEVIDLIATGPSAVLVIENGTEKKEFLIPFVGHYIDGVDKVLRIITVDWQLDY